MLKSLLTLALCTCLVGSATAASLKIGVNPVPQGDILLHAKQLAQKEGVDIEIIEFNDYVQPNFALDDKSLDANYFQHLPYLESFKQDHKLDIVPIANIHIEPMAAYSKKIKDIKNLQRGARIAIPNDPSNGGRALQLLARHGIIKLKRDDTNVTVYDISENKLNLRFIELEAALLPRVISDVDIAVINTNYAIEAKLNPLKDSIIIEDLHSQYIVVLATRPELEDNADLQKLVKIMNSDHMRDYINNKYQGMVIPAF